MSTIIEVWDTVTTLYYMQRVNMEAADELGAQAAQICKRIPADQRLREVADKPTGTGTTVRFGHLYDRKMGDLNTVSAFDKATSLYPFLSGTAEWPAFKRDAEFNVKQEHIEAWTELIGLSEEAVAIQTQITATGSDIINLLHHRADPAQDLKGWYVSVHTSRRNITGWVVGGRGNSIHIQRDPLMMIERLLSRPNRHREAITDDRPIRHLANRITLDSFLQGNPPETFSIKHSTVELRLPPDLAAERKEWTERMWAIAVENKDEAKDIHTAYLRWEVDAAPILKRDKAVETWHKGLPKSLRENWVAQDQMRWIVGATEAIEILFDLMPETDVREAIIAKYRAKHTELFVTDAERALLDNPPALGADSFEETLANVVTSKHSGLAPTF